jgi:hypothetical protein
MRTPNLLKFAPNTTLNAMQNAAGPKAVYLYVESLIMRKISGC